MQLTLIPDIPYVPQGAQTRSESWPQLDMAQFAPQKRMSSCFLSLSSFHWGTVIYNIVNNNNFFRHRVFELHTLHQSVSIPPSVFWGPVLPCCRLKICGQLSESVITVQLLFPYYAFLHHIYKEGHSVSVPLLEWLHSAWSPPVSSTEHQSAWFHPSLEPKVVFSCVSTPWFLIHLPVLGHLGYFQAMHIVLQYTQDLKIFLKL